MEEFVLTLVYCLNDCDWRRVLGKILDCEITTLTLELYIFFGIIFGVVFIFAKSFFNFRSE